MTFKAPQPCRQELCWRICILHLTKRTWTPTDGKNVLPPMLQNPGKCSLLINSSMQIRIREHEYQKLMSTSTWYPQQHVFQCLMFGETLIFDVIIVSHPTETTTFTVNGCCRFWVCVLRHKDARLSPLTQPKKHMTSIPETCWNRVSHEKKKHLLSSILVV